MPFDTQKAYVKNIRSATYAALISKLKDGEIGLVKGGKRIVMNDNASYEDLAVHKSVPNFNALQLSKQLTQPDNGGANAAAAGTVTLSDEAEIIFAPTASNKNHYKLAVSASIGRRVTLKNNSAYVVFLGEVANMKHGAEIEIPPNKTTEILSDGTVWWWDNIIEQEKGTFTGSLAGFTYFGGTETFEYIRQGDIVAVTLLVDNVFTIASGYSDIYIEFPTTTLPSHLLPTSGNRYWGTIATVIYNGTDYVSCSVEIASNGTIKLSRIDGSTFDEDILIEISSLSFQFHLNTMT